MSRLTKMSRLDNIISALENIFFGLLCFILIVSPYFRLFTKLVFFTALGCYLLIAVLKYKWRFYLYLIPHNFLNKTLLLFAFSCWLSIFFSQNFHHSQKIFFNRYLLYAFALWSGAQSFNKSENKLRILIGSMLISTFILAIGVIKDIPLLNPGRLFTAYGKGIPFKMLQLFVAYFASFNFAIALFIKNKKIKILSSFILILFIPCFIWGGSRAAWIAVTLSTLFLGLCKSRSVFLKILLAWVLVFFIGLSFPQIGKKIETIPHPSQWSYRTPLYSAAIAMFEDYPFIGAGVGMYEKMIKAERYALPDGYPNAPQDLFLHAHSTYLEVLAEMGIIGFLLFLSIFAVFFINFEENFKKIKSDNEIAVIAGISSLVVATLIFGVTSSVIIVGVNEAIMFWFLFGFATLSLQRSK